MSDISFSDKSISFQTLVTQARDAAKDGKITDVELKALEKTAKETDNNFSDQEKAFISALGNKGNVEIINSANFNPSDFKLVAGSKVPSSTTPATPPTSGPADVTFPDAGDLPPTIIGDIAEIKYINNASTPAND